ncbi:ABC transporter permease [Zhihengliuella salsuginis]|uniref:ABC transporter permease n=1 Tax=Zhihengliuella salsuginis TaxID=578222 RepID=A0ABQ3GDM3_9MICC|nr:ABC transporter permease subunit [Zhihengliuella salsuginis]GHD00305.1 ABC transporter permease [Zhihengliuella salsuginis]
MTWFSHAWGWVLELTWAHLWLSLPAILLSVAIAVPVGRLAFRRPGLGGALLSGSSLLYSIPALPLLIIVPAVFGVPLRSSATIIIALTVYGAALMVRTAADAFASVDSHVREAAIAVGHAPRELFWKVDLPLAVPVLVAGLRVVTVSTVGLVTIGALIGVPSLGTLFTDGFQRGIVAEVATGLIATVVLALALDGLCLLAGRALTPWRRAVEGAGA